jgi:catechol 2,3-dioxygenase-like lactoylglutathione lyase family enzyme
MKPLLLLCAVNLLAADQLPIDGFSHAGFRVADIEKTRAFYTGVLGFQQAFGQPTLAVFKINDDQFLEFNFGTSAGTADRFTHLAYLTQKLEPVRLLIDALGLNPPGLRTGKDRTRNFSIKDPDGHRVEFVEYEPDSMHAQARGKFADTRRISTRLDHVAIPVTDRDRAAQFFQGKLGPVAASYIDFLAPGAPVRLCFEVPDKAHVTTMSDPDGTPIDFIERPR